MQHQPVILIANGTQGLGKTCAKDFCDKGAHVIVADLAMNRGPAIVQQLGDNARYLPLDVTKQADWRQLIRKIMALYGRLDVLVNAPSPHEHPQVWHRNSAQYLAYLERTQRRVIWGTTAAAAIMRHQTHGSIVNVLTAQPKAFDQQLTTFLHHWTQDIARDLTGTEVRVNTVQVRLNRPTMTWNPKLTRPQALQQTIRYLAIPHSISPSGRAFVIPVH